MLFVIILEEVLFLFEFCSPLTYTKLKVMEDRKKAHIDLVFQSQTLQSTINGRFNYEPILYPHPGSETESDPFPFLGKMQKVPLWVSSMTGGTKMGKTINSNLAKVCREFGIGMGLGSCRVLLDDDTHLADFDVRYLIGDDLPFYANLGIAQIEKMIAGKELDKISILIDKLQADGLIIHVNPIQEWFQPEGDRWSSPPIDSIKTILDRFDFPIVVKEVGQGMGPASIRELLMLPLQAIEFAAYGGTNFAKMELLRNNEKKQHFFEPFAYVGHDAEEMTEFVNQVVKEEKNVACKEIIISGGIVSFLHGYYLVKKCALPAVYGQASSFLKYAKESYEELYEYVDYQVRGLIMASVYLSLKEND